MSYIVENSVCENRVVVINEGGIQRLSDALQRIKCLMVLWMNRYRQRKQLAQLPPYILKDLGLSQDQVYEEIHKPFWK